MSLGPNDVQSCPSPGRLKDHLAHGELCPACDPEVEWTARCPRCLLDVRAQGVVVLPHPTVSPWLVESSRQCPGAGVRVQPPAVRERPAWTAQARVRGAA